MYNPHTYLRLWDILMTPVVLMLIYFFANQIKKQNIQQYPYYKYLLSALFFKILGGISFNLIYMFYYWGGDTIEYFRSAEALVNLFFREPDVAFSILLGNNTVENLSHFTAETGYPGYLYHDTKAFAVSRFSWIFVLLSANHMYIATYFLDLFAFIGFWKFYTMLCELYPRIQRQLAFGVFLIPSVFFWGSGIMKDTYTISSALWLTYNFYRVFIAQKKVFSNILLMLMNIYIIVSIKPYVVVSLLPSLLIWISYAPIKKIRSKVLRFMVAPTFIGVGILLGFLVLNVIKKDLGDYSSTEKILKKAKITQEDLKRAEAYGINYFDIGTIEFTVGGMLSKAPMAINAGLFRPYLWEARNPVMVLSALENAAFMLFVLYMFWQIGIIGFFRNLTKEPFALIAFIYAIIFAFSVGLTTANFGALVRYKIPALPFLTTSLLILWEHHRLKKEEKEKLHQKLLNTSVNLQ